MNKYQSIISAIISAICIFVLPQLQKHGIVLDETTATTVTIYIVGGITFLWTAWKNHNLTDAAFEAQLIMKELKSGEDAESLEEVEEAVENKE